MGSAQAVAGFLVHRASMKTSYKTTGSQPVSYGYNA